MGSRFLLLDIAPHGMAATVMEKKISGFTPMDRSFAARNELPEILPEGVSWYRAALDAISEKTALSSCTEALVLIPCRDVFFRNISLPFSSPGKIAQVLPLELASYLPEETCVSDFISLDIRFVKDQHMILTASAADEMVQEMLSCLKDWHIRPRIITPREIALSAACIRQAGLTEDRIVIHTGLGGITLILMSGLKPVMVRSLALSELTPGVIARHLMRMATGFRHRSGLDTRFHICLVPETDALEPATLTKAIQQTEAPASFFLEDPLTVLEPDPALVSDLLLKKSGDLINFAKQYSGFGSFFHKFQREMLVTGIFGALVVVLSGLTLFQDVHHLEKQVAAARLAGIEIYQQTFPRDTVSAGHSPLLRMQAQVKQALSRNSGTRPNDMNVTPALSAIDVLYELSSRIPEGMNLQLSRLLFNESQVTISGTTDSFNTVDRLKNTLEQSDIFKSVTIHTADAGRVENQVIFQFRIEM